MKLVVHQFDPRSPQIGGVETLILSAAAHADELSQCLVGLSTETSEIGHAVEVRIRGTRQLFFPVARPSRRPLSLSLAQGFARHRHRLQTLSPEVVEFHRADVSTVAGPAMRGVHRRTIIHGDAANGATDTRWRQAQWAFLAFERLAIRSSEEVIVFSHAGAERLAQHPNVRYCPSWFEPDVFFPPVDGQPRARRLLWVGRLEESKDPVLAIRVFAAVASRDPCLTLELVGAGTLAERCRRLVDELDLADRVHFAGPQPLTAIADRMRTSAALLITSQFEGSPLVVAEALACDLPVVATHVADPDGLVVTGRTGETVHGRDPDALAAACLRVVNKELVQVSAAVHHRRADVVLPTCYDRRFSPLAGR